MNIQVHICSIILFAAEWYKSDSRSVGKYLFCIFVKSISCIVVARYDDVFVQLNHSGSGDRDDIFRIRLMTFFKSNFSHCSHGFLWMGVWNDCTSIFFQLSLMQYIFSAYLFLFQWLRKYLHFISSFSSNQIHESLVTVYVSVMKQWYTPYDSLCSSVHYVSQRYKDWQSIK